MKPDDNDETRITQLRSEIIPRKDAAVQQMLSQWQQQEQQQQDTSQSLLELLTYMQQELAALQQELASLEGRRLQEQQQEEAGERSQQFGSQTAGCRTYVCLQHLRADAHHSCLHSKPKHAFQFS
jgi:chromosome segregation ATPase